MLAVLLLRFWERWTVARTLLRAADMTLLDAAFGAGVHSYNTGSYSSAFDDLSQAIHGGSTDPRAYYFRGLTQLKLGRELEAQADFRAEPNLKRLMRVGFIKSVEALSACKEAGGRRWKNIERKARLVNLNRKMETRSRRYESTMANEQDVLRQAPLRNEIKADGDHPHSVKVRS